MPLSTPFAHSRTIYGSPVETCRPYHCDYMNISIHLLVFILQDISTPVNIFSERLVLGLGNRSLYVSNITLHFSRLLFYYRHANVRNETNCNLHIMDWVQLKYTKYTNLVKLGVIILDRWPRRHRRRHWRRFPGWIIIIPLRWRRHRW